MNEATSRLLQNMQKSLLRSDYYRLKSALKKAKNTAQKK
jgi:hypothetical protein